MVFQQKIFFSISRKKFQKISIFRKNFSHFGEKIENFRNFLEKSKNHFFVETPFRTLKNTSTDQFLAPERISASLWSNFDFLRNAWLVRYINVNWLLCNSHFGTFNWVVKLGKTRSGAKNWSVDVFFSVLNVVSTKKWFFDFSKKFQKYFDFFTKMWEILAKNRNFLNFFRKIEEIIFCWNIISTSEKHV